MPTKPTEPSYSDEETERRRDEALRRALSTPPKPGKAGKSAPEATGRRGKSEKEGERR